MVEPNNKSSWQKKFLIMFVLVVVIIITIMLVKYQGRLVAKPSAVTSTSPNRFFQNIQEKPKYADIKQITIWYLVTMADIALYTNEDVKTALAFLLRAKKYTSAFETTVFIDALNKDISNLQAIPVVDAEGLFTKIDIISQKINLLPIISQQKIVETKAKLESVQHAGLLNGFFISVAKALKDVVVIRRQTVDQQLSQDQIEILRFNIQTRLSLIELAIMQKQNKLYQIHLSQVVELITKNFVQKNAVTANVLDVLQEMKKINLKPKLPAQLESLSMVEL